MADARGKIDAKMREIHGDLDVPRDQNVFPYVDINSNLYARAGRNTCPIPTERSLHDFIERTFASPAFNVHQDA